jgi:hypothetical protein
LLKEATQAFSSVAVRCLAKGSSIRLIFNQKSKISNQQFWILCLCVSARRQVATGS